MADSVSSPYDYKGGVLAPWYRGWEISEEKRDFFRETAQRSREAKLRALSGDCLEFVHPINTPAFDPGSLMPPVSKHGLAALSVFSGGGGLDLGFDRAGYLHVAAYDTLEAAGATLRANQPDWSVFSGTEGDVRAVNWRAYRGVVDVLHGGAPCQPFSIAGRQEGRDDGRNLLPEFVRCVLQTRPSAFAAENVPALVSPKFAAYLQEAFYEPLGRHYHVATFRLSAHAFGVPQVRQRVFFIGFRRKRDLIRFVEPQPTHRIMGELPNGQPTTAGARAALGLPDIGFDALAPTLRSTLTGPRHTTSILSSVSAQRTWTKLEIWPNGVAATREAARAFPPENRHFRLSVPDCALLQGFPESWGFKGAVYMALGQIGNSVAPPVAYKVGRAIAEALHGC